MKYVLGGAVIGALALAGLAVLAVVIAFGGLGLEQPNSPHNWPPWFFAVYLGPAGAAVGFVFGGAVGAILLLRAREQARRGHAEGGGTLEISDEHSD